MGRQVDEWYLTWDDDSSSSGDTATLNDTANHDSDMVNLENYGYFTLVVETTGATSHDGTATVVTFLGYTDAGVLIDEGLKPTGIDAMSATTASAATNITEYQLTVSTVAAERLLPYIESIRKFKIRLSNGDGATHTVTCKVGIRAVRLAA